MKIKNGPLFAIVVLASLASVQLTFAISNESIFSSHNLFPAVVMFATGIFLGFIVRKRTPKPNENSFFQMEIITGAIGLFTWQTILPNWFTYTLWAIMAILIAAQLVVDNFVNDCEQDLEAVEEDESFKKTSITFLIVSVIQHFGFADSSVMAVAIGSGAYLVFLVIWIISTPDERSPTQLKY